MKRFSIVVFLALAACNSAADKSSPATTQRHVTSQISEFWQWFAHNKAQYEDMKAGEDPDLDLLIKHLTTIESGLAVEISATPGADSLMEITISAEGDIHKFPLVEEIVAKAPSIEGWKVTAFRQPIKPDFTLKQGRMRLTPSELFFEPIVKQDSLDIIVYGKDFGKQNPDTLAFFGFIMLDNLMGEYNSVKRVRHYDFKDLSEVRRESDLSPLQDINKFLDGYYEKRQ